jgi:hypothetical protein
MSCRFDKRVESIKSSFLLSILSMNVGHIIYTNLPLFALNLEGCFI